MFLVWNKLCYLHLLVDGKSRGQERESSDAPDGKTSMTNMDTQGPASLSDDKSLGTKQIQHRCVKTVVVFNTWDIIYRTQLQLVRYKLDFVKPKLYTYMVHQFSELIHDPGKS